jgi:recombination protein RecT
METKTKQVEKYSPVSLTKTLDDHVKNGTIIVPDGYNFIAAINSAMYLLSEATDRNGKPALEVCTAKSINYSLTKMVLLGLNPMQKQGYFIVYGNELQFMPSYFGDRAMAERTGITDIVARVVYDTDEFSCEFVDGYPVIKHIFGVKEKIVKEASFITHAYCLFTLPNGRRAGDVMTFAQILKSWAHSKDPNRKSQNDSPEEMAKRTVTRRALKPYINSFVGDDVITDKTEDEQVIVLEQDSEEIQEPETSSEVENKEPEAVKQETEAKKQNFKNTEIPF